MQQQVAAFTAVNPLQRVPALVLDDGTVITESIAICRYFEELQPEPPLFGRGALESARVEMWNRRLELHFLFPVSQVFRNSHPAMKEMEVPQVPAWGEANKPRDHGVHRAARRRARATGRSSPATSSRSPTSPAWSRVDFMKPAKLAVPTIWRNLKRWHAEVSARPSASA